MSLGKNIKKMRSNSGLTQKDMARLLGVSDKTISSWEIDRTEPNMGMVEKMCEIMHCTKSELISGSLEVPEYDPIMAEAVVLLGKISKEQKLAVLSLLRSFTN